MHCGLSTSAQRLEPQRESSRAELAACIVCCPGSIDTPSQITEGSSSCGSNYPESELGKGILIIGICSIHFISWFSWIPRKIGICNILKGGVFKISPPGSRGSSAKKKKKNQPVVSTGLLNNPPFQHSDRKSQTPRVWSDGGSSYVWRSTPLLLVDLSLNLLSTSRLTSFYLMSVLRFNLGFVCSVGNLFGTQQQSF